ncbi:TetR/AcrR family transcriptional regulator [Acinetobacter seifertii]|uniref:TetR/AcrR family transcriptional regulator n=1 Tax=Acinetobacter seifertii TaxID=1530123 RepID=UPI000D37CAD9|nr:TetR/AcrR family transcriptional regulator [Acinetobacter seifertii]PTV50886.1 TetR family transcriptional regulator [Acinetobacter seifertii]
MSKRDTIITTAIALFNQKSYNGIGIDKIIAESNVAKMTFYKYFPSKENLIESCLYKRNSDIQAAILERINTKDLPLVQLRSLFDWYIDWIYTDDFNGCLFKKATMEVVQVYPSVKKPINDYREWIYTLVFSILIKVYVEDPEALTTLFLNILDGIIIDGTIDKGLVNREKTWSYIIKIIELEKTEARIAS